MSETVNQDATTAEQAERTFTQAEVDAIVSDRLKRERAKYPDYDALKEKASRLDQIEEASKTELQKAIERGDALQVELDSIKRANSLRTMRDAVSAETGVPANLLTADTEDGCREQAQAILAFRSPANYPDVRDAGETRTTLKGTPQQSFADWASEVFG